MQPSTSPSGADDARAVLGLTVVSFDDVARVIGLLRGRRYRAVHVDAHRCADGSWTLDLVIAGRPEAGQLLKRRLERVPGVIVVDINGSRHRSR